MEERETKDKIFLPYGCNKAPKAYQRNEDIFCHSCCKLDVYDWLKDYNSFHQKSEFEPVEVRFKNSRKEYFQVPSELKLSVGDIIAVEASPGHDIGIVALTGVLVPAQMKKKKLDPEKHEYKKVYRKARSSDIEKWISATQLEESTKFKTKKIAKDLNLNMKINDVEYQGDKTKAIFYYTAEDRVDFRELIKVLAEAFSVRIEMKQIGVRQEAARIGGIASCGRELCCVTWLTNFRSVSTNTARGQQLSLNPQKLAGQCGKLKCCLNYEYDSYMDAIQNLPDVKIELKSKKGVGVYHKTDVHKGILWYVYKNEESIQIPIHFKDVKKIIEMNRNNKLPAKLEEFEVKMDISKDIEYMKNDDNLMIR